MVISREMRCGCIGGSSGKQEEEEEEIMVSGNIKKLSYNELKTATHDFHPANKIGRGGFGIVYKVPTLPFILTFQISP